MSQLVFRIFWNPKEVDSNASEGMDLLVMPEQAGKYPQLPSSLSLYRLPKIGMAQIRSESYHLKSSGLKVCLPTSEIWTRIISFHFKTSHKCVPLFWGLN